MVLLFVDFLAPHSVYLEGLAKLVELVLENQVDLFFEVLSWLSEGAIELQCLEVNIFLGHKIDKLIDAQTIFLGASQLEDNLSLIISDVISILPDYLLHLVGPNFPIFGKSLEVPIKIPSLSVVLDEGLLEFVQFEHVDILSFEL